MCKALYKNQLLLLILAIKVCFSLLFLLGQSNLKYSKKQEQQQLLQQVLLASDIDAEEEKIPGDSAKGSSQVKKRFYFVFHICDVPCDGFTLRHNICLTLVCFPTFSPLEKPDKL